MWWHLTPATESTSSYLSTALGILYSWTTLVCVMLLH
jgi:hypothetical protein